MGYEEMLQIAETLEGLPAPKREKCLEKIRDTSEEEMERILRQAMDKGKVRVIVQAMIAADIPSESRLRIIERIRKNSRF